ncbi:MAG: hypothetical protein ACRDRO_08515 [Pseudonocardiaceae bacterium]
MRFHEGDRDRLQPYGYVEGCQGEHLSPCVSKRPAGAWRPSRAGDLVLRLTPWEKVGALHGDLRVPLRAVRMVSVVAEPWNALRGIRAPGTGWPGWIMLGTTWGKFGKDFAAVYRRRPPSSSS